MKKLMGVGCLLWLVACGSNKESIHGYAHGIAVINSDYHSTALTLLDPNGNTVVDPCLNSGSASPRLSLALSGDVVLPTQSPGTGELALVDRTNNAIVWVNPLTCGVQRQLAVSPGANANPHDYLGISATKGYVTLYGAETGAGNNVAIVNPNTAALVGTIIVSTLATLDNNNVATLARPDRIIWANGMVFVTLGNVDATYTSFGPGRVVIIDPNSDQVMGHIDIGAGRGCSGMATAGHVLAVGCDGDTSNPNQVTNSAIFTYDISAANAPQLTGTITAEQLQSTSVFSNSLAVDGGHVYFAATGAADVLYQDTTALLTVAGTYELGGIVLAGGDVYAADAATGKPAVIRAQGSTVLQRITSAPASLLPPRALLAY